MQYFLWVKLSTQSQVYQEHPYTKATYYVPPSINYFSRDQAQQNRCIMYWVPGENQGKIFSYGLTDENIIYYKISIPGSGIPVLYALDEKYLEKKS